MKHGSLFSGIGGFDLAASWVGWENVFQCEIDPFCQKILKYHFTESELLTDIKTTNFTKYNGTIDIISGGFPCQPFSVAGKRKGTDDNRFLWTEMLRAIREINPAWVVAENVRGLITQQDGVVFERVQADLEGEGYEVQPVIIPACAVNAPHRRDRVWIIAYRSNARLESLQRERKDGISESIASSDTESIDRNERRSSSERINGNKKIRTDVYGRFDGLGEKRFATNTASERHKEWKKNKSVEFMQNFLFTSFPTQSPVCSRNDGISSRLDGITFPKWRSESIKAYGNAIVPQVAYEIFKVIAHTGCVS